MIANSVATSATSEPSPGAQVAASIDREKEESALSNFNDFLTLLTAQMRNQDPTKPIDSTQFVDQLASFASVEQQVGSNKKLNALIEQGKTDEINELANWVGRNIEAGQAFFDLGDGGLSVDVPVVENATSIDAIISNAEGVEIMRVPVENGAATFVWDGKLESGADAPAKHYAVAFNYALDDQSPRQIEARATGNVIEARLDEAGPMLFLDSGVIARISDIERVGTRVEKEDE